MQILDRDTDPVAPTPWASTTDNTLRSFRELSLSAPVARALDEMDYDVPTEIQAAAIPVLMAGRDVMGQAQTGTGKTAAFGIPMIELIDTERPEVQAIVLAPTRELAMQISKEVARIGGD